MLNEFLFFAHLITILSIITYATRTSLAMLSTVLALNIVCANFFVLKQIVLFGFTVTATDVFIVSITLGLGIMQKIYGEQAVRNAIFINLCSSFFVIAFAFFHLMYAPALVDTTQMHYQTLLYHMPRIIGASIMVSWCTEQFHRILMRTFLPRFNATIATVIATFIAQTGDTIAFSFIGLYGIAHSVVDIMQVSLIIKYILIVSAAPVLHFMYRCIKAPHVSV